MTKPLALIIDDEPDLLSLLAISLDRMGIDCHKAGSVSEALDALSANHYDLCLTDLRLPDGSGLDIVRQINVESRQTPVAVITAFGDAKTAVTALKTGAFDYVSKPLDLVELQTIVNTALRIDQHTPHGGTAASGTTEDGTSRQLLGDSEEMQKTRALIEKVARTQAPVHIYGETGTGKELIARLIHERSPRASQPFVPVNCGAIPRELMESEFFGHKKGSFTGAHQDAEGLFRSANGGTLFLDEIGDLPQELQVKLLRVIQEKRVRPVGESRELPVDVRIISATHRNLAQLVDRGDFRQDFFYRINVILIVAPPLRDRPSDIRPLAEHIAARLTGEESPGPQFSDAALAVLEKLPFPGNVRELENIIERAIALSDSGIIDEDDLDLPDLSIDSQFTIDDPSYLSIDDHTRLVEIERITTALEETGGNVTEAAKTLGTSFRSLRYRIKKLGIAG